MNSILIVKHTGANQEILMLFWYFKNNQGEIQRKF
jgi:hypothetical protein